MSVVDFASRRSITERLAAAEGMIASLEALVASQQRTIELLGDAAQAWLNSGTVFRGIGEQFRDHEGRLAELQSAVNEIRATQAVAGVGSGPVSGTAAGEGVRLSPAAAAARLSPLAEPPTDLRLR